MQGTKGNVPSPLELEVARYHALRVKVAKLEGKGTGRIHGVVCPLRALAEKAGQSVHKTLNPADCVEVPDDGKVLIFRGRRPDGTSCIPTWSEYKQRLRERARKVGYRVEDVKAEEALSAVHANLLAGSVIAVGIWLGPAPAEAVAKAGESVQKLVDNIKLYRVV